MAEMETDVERFSRLVVDDPDDFDAWEGLLQATEAAEGGLHRGSSPQAIAAMRSVYDRFLHRFPLLFGYWKKYADLEFAIAGTESAELVYERGVAGISSSVDLWSNYCAFKMETSHEQDDIRDKCWWVQSTDASFSRLFERGANHVGLDFLAHPFWDKYLEYEERMENWEGIYRILERIVHIPMHQYARYFERFTQMAVTRPVTDLLPEDIISTFREDVMNEPIPPPPSGQAFSAKRTEMEVEREIRLRIHNIHLEIYQKTQTETTKRWAFESEIKRPYFHVRELDEAQLVNWRKYLDFEEIDGNFKQIQFLYERCLVTCALYEEFWLRYARWMSAQPGKAEELRMIYLRGSTCFVPVCRLSFRFQFALFEESQGNLDFALDIYQSILDQLPGNLETIMHIVHMHRRQDPLNYEKTIATIKEYIDHPDTDPLIRGSLFAEWARVLWKCKGSVDEARALFQENVANYKDNRYFWINYLRFEMAQPVKRDVFKKIYNVITLIRTKSHLPPATIKDLSHVYMEYLLESATTPGIIHEFCRLDREVNGPWSIQSENKLRLTDDGDITSVERRLRAESGHPGVLISEEDIRDSRNPYDKYFEQQGEIPPAADSSANGV